MSYWKVYTLLDDPLDNMLIGNVTRSRSRMYIFFSPTKECAKKKMISFASPVNSFKHDCWQFMLQLLLIFSNTENAITDEFMPVEIVVLFDTTIKF